MQRLNYGYYLCAFLVMISLITACMPPLSPVSNENAPGNGRNRSSQASSTSISNETTCPEEAWVRKTQDEASEMIRDYFLSHKPDLSSDFPLALEEMPPAEDLTSMQVQLFRVTEGPYEREFFLIAGESLLQMGSAVGGQGLTSLKVADLDGDGNAELLFAYSYGSGIHQSRIGMYAPAHDENHMFEADFVFLGDLGLVVEDSGMVSVRVLQSDENTLTLRYLDALGHLMLDKQNGQVELGLTVNEDLPADVSEKLLAIGE